MKKPAKNNKNPIDPTAITYKVNHATKAIELSATAAKKASQYGSPAYNLLRKILIDFPGYTVEVKSPRKTKSNNEVNSAAHLKGLTFKRMEAYIDSHDDENHSIRKHYDKLRGNSAEARAINASSYSYIKMRDWFLKQFPEILEFLNNREELINAKSDTTAAA